MAAIEDRDYLRICAELATCLSISIASARRKVELAAIKQGYKDPLKKKALAEKLLLEARQNLTKDDQAIALKFDKLLEALAEEENFMTED